jgi:hypothetical protein
VQMTMVPAMVTSTVVLRAAVSVPVSSLVVRTAQHFQSVKATVSHYR